MPVLFIGHGSPLNAIEDNEFVVQWRKLGQSLPKPAAILCISAHWETRGTSVTVVEKPETIHDFGGFPKALFEVQYPAPGNPVLAKETKMLIKNTRVSLEDNWGLDHGTWSFLVHMYPEADIPVIQLSLDYYQDSRFHYELAKELAPLREKGVLIVGSGNMIHNLSLVAWEKLNDDEYGYDWALEASDKMKHLIRNGDHTALVNYDTLGREVKLSVPTPEHYLPLLYALALKNENEGLGFFNDKTIGGSMSMTSLKIGM